MNKTLAVILGSAILAIGMVGMAFVLKAGMDNNTFRGRTISSRGVATRVVQADCGTGRLSISYTNPTSALSAKEAAKNDLDSVIEFALSYGIPKDAIKINPAEVGIRHHYDNDGRATDTYYEATIYARIYVTDDDVLKLNKMDSEIDKLIDKGIILENSYFYYSYSDQALTAIKAEMSTEATKNARSTAEQLAADNNCQVGDIVSVEQGYFEVDDIEGRPEYEKSVRVVNHAQFYLK